MSLLIVYANVHFIYLSIHSIGIELQLNVNQTKVQVEFKWYRVCVLIESATITIKLHNSSRVERDI